MYQCQDCLEEFESPNISALVVNGGREEYEICPHCGSDMIQEILSEK